MKKSTGQMITVLGWCGIVAILLAYALNSLNLVPVSHHIYQLLNLGGAIGLILEGAMKRDSPVVVLNVVWASIAIISLVSFI
jgi:hypothetical protein